MILEDPHTPQNDNEVIIGGVGLNEDQGRPPNDDNDCMDKGELELDSDASFSHLL